MELAVHLKAENYSASWEVSCEIQGFQYIDYEDCLLRCNTI